MAQITIFVGGADYLMPFYLFLCGANCNLKKWRKLSELIFRYGVNYINIYIFFLGGGGCFWHEIIFDLQL